MDNKTTITIDTYEINEKILFFLIGFIGLKDGF